MSHLEKILDETFGIKKPKQIEVSLERLNPPQKPRIEKVSDALAIDFNNLDPKYQKWALSLETQRHYYYTKFGKTHRKDTKEVKKDLEEKEIELDAIEVMKKEKTPAFMGVINEFKAKLAKIRGRKDDL